MTISLYHEEIYEILFFFSHAPTIAKKIYSKAFFATRYIYDLLEQKDMDENILSRGRSKISEIGCEQILSRKCASFLWTTQKDQKECESEVDEG